MKKLIVGIPMSFILMTASCTDTLQQFQDRNSEDDNNVEEVSDEQTDVEEVEDSDDEADTEIDDDTDDAQDSEVTEDEEDPEDTEEDPETEEDTETETEDEAASDEDAEESTESDEEEADEPVDPMDELPEEIIQEFVRLNERIETQENRLNTLERHLNEAEDEISRLYDSLGNKAAPRDGEEEAEADDREEIEVLDTSDGRGSRSEPFDVGDTVAIEVFEYANGFNRLFGTAEITINDVVTGDEAYEILQGESRFNTEAPEGYEWSVISMTFYLADFEDDDISIGVSDSISIVSESGSTPPNEYALPPTPLTYTEVFSGGEVRGNLAKLVPEDESFLIYFDSFKAEDLFFLYDRDEEREEDEDEDSDRDREEESEEEDSEEE